MTTHNIIIIGSGPAGYSAAIYAQRAGLKTLLIEGLQVGGQLTLTTHVENYPGFKSILGTNLMQNMREQALELGVEIKSDYITQANLNVYPYQLQGSGSTYLANSIIICTGSSAKWLDAKGVKELAGFGVSTCATCDGFFFKNQNVAVVGGGNSALEESLYLAGIAKQVHLIHRRDTFRGEHIMVQRVKNTPNITIHYNSQIVQAISSPTAKELTALQLTNNQTNTTSTLNVNGLFIAIGHNPNTQFVKDYLMLDEDNYLVTHNNGTQALDKNGNVKKGVFVAGDVRDKIYRQAISSAGFGAMAALDAYKFLQH